jgi:ABC-type antimicrobial peptide transport system permease subunit
MALVVRTGDMSGAQLERIKREIWKVDAEAPVTQVRRLGEVVAESLDAHRFHMLLFGVFAAIALTLAAAGVFAVISFLVAQRQREIGIRVAMGARPGDVLGLVMRETGWLAGAGLVAGFAGFAAVQKWMKSMLYGVEWLDPVSIGWAVGLLALVALAAVAGPSRRALRTNAAEVLRTS